MVSTWDSYYLTKRYRASYFRILVTNHSCLLCRFLALSAFLINTSEEGDGKELPY